MTAQDNSKQSSVWSREFLLINTILFIAAAGLAVFFDLQRHLESLAIPKYWIGALISADGLAGLAVQIVITPFLHQRNARPAMFAGVLILCAAFVGYRWAADPGTMLAVRMLHGCGFVVLVSSLMVALVHVIPEGRSGYAFGIVSTTRLIPYALVPPLLGLFPGGAANFGQIVLVAAAGIFALLPLVALLRPRPPANARAAQLAFERPPLRQQLQNLGEARIANLMVQTLLLSAGYAIIFFYIRQYAVALGITNAGLFFALATVTMIAARLASAPLMDRYDKRRIAMGGLALLACAFALLWLGAGYTAFLASGLVAGLGWGIAMPAVSALVFDTSAPAFRGFNINASMVMVQASFFVGPMAGGIALAASGYAALFAGCALVSLVSAVLLSIMPSVRQTELGQKESG
ncbi:MAG: major facilitator superfamily 1 [Burkholderiaceae bacterium]|nr:major facilitator superfamily 1 [Burkholderiaceae bacterium]